jgi:ADP-ribose pyrophosphatase YjhB (NUDIX family)
VTGPLPKEEFDAIFAKVPRLTVEVLIASPERGVLLGLRDVEPCKGTWNLPGGTVRFGEPLVNAVRRVAAAELDLEVDVGAMVGYIEYPSHYEHGLDSPVGIVFEAQPLDGAPTSGTWFKVLPENMHAEQKLFLVTAAPVTLAPGDPDAGSKPIVLGHARPRA